MFRIAIAALFVIAVVVLFVALRPRIARADLLKQGDDAPLFSTQAVVGQQIKPVSLGDFKGRTVILYFYPKDFTSGCTKEACSFRDGFTKFERAGIEVLGCSIDSSDSHKSFIEKYHLPFPLLLDPDKKIAKDYGAANGIPVLGLDGRITYVIDGQGKIAKVYAKVDPSQHVDQIMNDLHAMGLDQPVATPTPSPVPQSKAPPPSSDEDSDDD